MTTQEPTGGPVVRTGKKNGEEGRLPVEQAAAYLPARAALREALLVYTIVSLTCVLLALGARLVPQASEYFYLGFPALFLLVPTWLVTRRDESFDPYGLGVGPWRRGLLYFAGVSLLIFPLFVYGYLLFYRLVCGWAAAGYSVPRLYRALCPHFDGRWIGDRLTLSWGFAERAASQVVVVALPEEYFFRGYLQTRFEQVWPPRRRLLGGASAGRWWSARCCLRWVT